MNKNKKTYLMSLHYHVFGDGSAGWLVWYKVGGKIRGKLHCKVLNTPVEVGVYTRGMIDCRNK